MIETINGKAYLKVGDKVYELGGGSNIITADSVEQLPDPASVPEGTVALVKSEGDSGGGLTVVELTTPITEGSMATLTDAEGAVLSEQAATGQPFILKFAYNKDAVSYNLYGVVAIAEAAGYSVYVLTMQTGAGNFGFTNESGSWTASTL